MFGAFSEGGRPESAGVGGVDGCVVGGPLEMDVVGFGQPSFIEDGFIEDVRELAG